MVCKNAALPLSHLVRDSEFIKLNRMKNLWYGAWLLLGLCLFTLSPSPVDANALSMWQGTSVPVVTATPEGEATPVASVPTVAALPTTALSVDEIAAEQAQILAQAQALLAKMTPAERVGQLFLVPFHGDTATAESSIGDLIRNYHIGGVILLAGNDNITGFGNPTMVPEQVSQLTNNLQSLALFGLIQTVSPNAPPQVDPDAVPPTSIPQPNETAVPLFIATIHEGDNSPNTQIHSGLTELPSSMAIGATWRPQYAQNMGQIAGRELAAIGINMLFGPSLDVLEKPDSFNPSDMGIRTFGGDPYWVGLMGQAYTAGVHTGSNGRVAVIVKHFPGNGSSDRPVNEEVPTVRKSLEQLKQIELAPFFAVTQGDPSSTADGLLTTHIRYQGFQGNIRATTAPVSFDPQALNTLMGLPEFATWRGQGGLIVSDELGVRAVERFYDDTGLEFPHRRVAKDALLAGNDVLYLGQFALGDASYDQQLANIQDTVVWFEEKYNTDPSFQARVDEAVLRILQTKLRLYEGDFSWSKVSNDLANVMNVVGRGNAQVLEVAQTAVTLISPSPTELLDRLPSPPGLNDQVVVFTDVQMAQQCSTCPQIATMGVTALQERMLALYGPNASEQIQPEQIQSFSFMDLEAFLNALPSPAATITPSPATAVVPTAAPSPTLALSGTFTTTLSTLPLATSTPLPLPTFTPTPSPVQQVQTALSQATWIIFALQGPDGQADALHHFLAQRPDILRNARIIVLAYNAPYYLDTTEISKLTAYYGIYSKTPAFIDASVRALFQESALTGASPVSIPGVSYDLFSQTQPDPRQVIALQVSNGDAGFQSPPVSEPLDMFIGDTLRLQTRVIVDHNGHQVPNGTLVRFVQKDLVQGLTAILAEVPTVDGIATLNYVLQVRQEAGKLRITAEAGEAVVSQEVDISIEGQAQVIVITPTPLPTDIPTQTPTPTQTLPATATATLTVTPEPTATPLPPQEASLQIGLADLRLLLAFVVGLVATAVAGLFLMQRQKAPLPALVGGILWSFIGSLLLYHAYLLGLPGLAWLVGWGSWAGLVTAVAGGVAGLILHHFYTRTP